MFEVCITNIDGSREVYDGLGNYQAQSLFFRAKMNPHTDSVELYKYIG